MVGGSCVPIGDLSRCNDERQQSRVYSITLSAVVSARRNAMPNAKPANQAGGKGAWYRVVASMSPRRFSGSRINFSRRLLWRLSVPLRVAPGMRVSLRGRRYRNRSCEGPAMPGQMRGWSGPKSWTGYIEDRLGHEFLTCGKDIRRGSIDELRVCT